jgi:membrane protease subunit (stomatin/prohibitin family)
MTLRDFIQGELIDVVEWLETSTDAMVWRFDRPDGELKNGAQLVVRPGQLAVFVDRGTIADVFRPGQHELTTNNLPLLSKLRGWKYGFESPFKAEVVFVSTRQFTGNKWGTKSPVMMRDPQLGAVRLRAYGTYSARVVDAAAFVRELAGANPDYTIGEIRDQLRDLVVARMSEVLGERAIPLLELAANYSTLGELGVAKLAPELAKLGVQLTQLVVENIALPDEVAATLDQRTRMSLIGDVAAYAQLQAADAVRDAARNQGTGGAGAAVGVGLGIAQQLSNTTAGAMRPPASGGPTPPPIPRPLAFFVATGTQPEGPHDLAALAQRVKDGSFKRETLVWREGMPAWVAASQVTELAGLFGG